MTHVKANFDSLRVIRALKGYSQTAAAEGAGIERANYAHIEAGRRPGTDSQLVSIAAFLKVPIGAIALVDKNEEAAQRIIVLADDIEAEAVAS